MVDKKKSYFLFYFPLFLLIVTLVIGLKDSLVPLIFSYFLAYLSFPTMIRLEKKGVPRIFSAAISFVLIMAIFILLGFLLIPPLLEELARALQNLPGLFEKLLLSSWIPENVRESILTFDPLQRLKELSPDQWKEIFPKIKSSFQGGMGLFQDLLALLLIPVFYFYVLLEYENLKQSFSLWIPKKSKPTFSKYFSEVREIWNAFFRGQFLVALSLSILYGTGLWISGIPYGLGLGVLSGLLSIIPYVGFTIGLATSLVIFIVSDLSYLQLFGILFTFGLGQFLESFFLTPKLVGERLGLNALWSIVALIVGGNLFGFFGLLFAIPLSSAIKLFFSYWLLAYKQHCEENSLL